MTDERTTGAEEATEEPTASESEEEGRTARERMSDGFQKGLGILSAFKEAMEETISEARERGDLSSDRAKEALKKAADRARSATADARERFDFVSQQDFDALVRRVEALEDRVRDPLGGVAADGAGEGSEEA